MFSDTRVLGVHEAVNPSRLQILFDGKAVTDVRLVMITVNNSGNEPIRADDFERALRFSWAEPARILTAEVVEVSPESLQPTIKAGVNEIVVDPLLLNRGDRLRIKTLINQGGKLSVDARVVGVKRIQRAVASGEVASARRVLFIALGGIAGLFIILVGEGLGFWVANGRVELALTKLVVVGYGFLHTRCPENRRPRVARLLSWEKRQFQIVPSRQRIQVRTQRCVVPFTRSIAAVRGSKWWYVGVALSSGTLAFFHVQPFA